MFGDTPRYSAASEIRKKSVNLSTRFSSTPPVMGCACPWLTLPKPVRLVELAMAIALFLPTTMQTVLKGFGAKLILSELTIKFVGPFSEATKICFEPDVTVLTGANDCGKTAILNAIELLCGMSGGERVLQESEVNLDRIGHASTDWKKDQEITIQAMFQITDFAKSHVRHLDPGNEIQVLCKLAPECRETCETKFRKEQGKGSWSSGGNAKVQHFPTVIRLPLADPIRTIIDLSAPNPTEKAFLKAAFGPQFEFAKYKVLTEGAFYAAVSKARGDANAKIRRIFPASMRMEFDFQTVNGERNKISVQLRDDHEGHTPMGFRGAGVRSLVSLMAALLCAEFDDRHYLILLDEPEISLHADAQHSLRAVLEALAEKPNIQVVYATHSPSMINPVLTSSLRLVKRENNGRIATTKIVERPVDENFLSIRSSLGLNASDSLLYGPVTIIVEGPSEVIGLPIILGRLWKESVEGFSEVGILLSQVHFLDGCGDSFDQLCKVAISQGTKPVVFLDGDKAGSRLSKLKTRFPEVPIILLDGRSEFEEIVSKEAYFEALNAVMQEFDERAEKALRKESFDEWSEGRSLPSQMAFSKRVNLWVEQVLGLSVEKPRVMKQALINVPIADVHTEPLLELVNQIRKQLT